MPQPIALRRRPRLEVLEDRLALSAAGSLDPAFGTGGMVSKGDLGGLGVTGLFPQPDGKLLTVARSSAVNPQGTGNLVVSRYDAAGKLDLSFHGSGQMTLVIPHHSGDAAGVAMDAEGRFIVAADSTDGASIFVARFTASGQPDTSFGVGGLATTSVPMFDSGLHRFAILTASAVRVQADGKVLVAGNCEGATETIGVLLVRFTADGRLDPSFGQDRTVAWPPKSETFVRGQVALPMGEDAIASGLAFQPDGKILVSSSVATSATGSDEFALARVGPDGQLDGSFGTGGVVRTDFGTRRGDSNGVEVQRDGKILVFGATVPSGDADQSHANVTVVRYLPGGALDPTFGSGGIYVDARLAMTEEEALQPDGKVILASATWSSAAPTFALRRLTAAGAVDDTFGTGGLVTAIFPGTTNGIASGVAVLPDGRIVAGGIAGDGSGNNLTTVLARYLGDPVARIAGRFAVAVPRSATAGAPLQVVVTAQDAAGHALAGYRGTVHFTSDDPSAVLPADYAFTAADAGVHRFGVTLKAAGTRKVGVTAPAMAGSASVAVAPGAATAARLTPLAAAKTGVAALLSVTLLDAFGNAAAAGRVAWASSDPRAVLPAAYTFRAADGGGHTFAVAFRTRGRQSLRLLDAATGRTLATLPGVNVT